MKTMQKKYPKPLCPSCQREYVTLLLSVERSEVLLSKSSKLYSLRHVPTAECAGLFSIMVPGLDDGSVVYSNRKIPQEVASSSTPEAMQKVSPMSMPSIPLYRRVTGAMWKVFMAIVSRRSFQVFVILSLLEAVVLYASGISTPSKLVSFWQSLVPITH